MLCLGGLTQGSHLFPFRTEKLSLVVPMIVLVAKVGSRQNRAFKLNTKKPLLAEWFFCIGTLMMAPP